jgi:hypothetical protein
MEVVEGVRCRATGEDLASLREADVVEAVPFEEQLARRDVDLLDDAGQDGAAGRSAPAYPGTPACRG